MCVTLASHLCERGYAIELIVTSLDGAVYQHCIERNKHLNLINLNNKHTRTAILSIIQYIKNNQPRIFMTFSNQQAIILVIIRYLLKLDFKVISRNISMLSLKNAYSTSYWHKYFVEWLTKLFYRKVDHIIAQSKQMQIDLADHYSINKGKISVIYNPIDRDIEKASLHPDIKKHEKKHDLLFVGRLSKEKGLFYLLEAFQKCLHKLPDLDLTIVGDGDQRDYLIEAVNKMDISECVHFAGFQKNVIPCYLSAKVTVLSSLYEGFPNVIAESIALGTPVVAFNCPSGPSELIEDGINGRLAEYKNSDDLSKKILMVLDESYDFKIMKKTVDRFFSYKSVNDYIELIDKYDSLV